MTLQNTVVKISFHFSYPENDIKSKTFGFFTVLFFEHILLALENSVEKKSKLEKFFFSLS